MSRYVITYRLRLEQPMVLTQPGGDANSADSLPYISGSSVLGAVAGKWKLTQSKYRNLAGDPGFADLFLNNRLCCTNAYPEGAKKFAGARLLPAPLSLRTEKGDETKVYDLAFPEEEQDYPENLRPWSQKFIGFDFSGEMLNWAFPDQEALIHHQRDRERGRATENSGAVFSYVSISTGETFIGHFLCENENIFETVKELSASGRFSFGRSKTAQYGGLAQIEILDSKNVDQFVEAGADTIADSGRWIVTLVSDYLGLDDKGHFRSDEDTFRSDLAKGLGLNPEDVSLNTKADIPAFVQARNIGGYLAPWSMPRPLRPAINKGSVFILSCSKAIDPVACRELLWTGIGDRRSEGFGRLVFNWHGLEEQAGALELHSLTHEHTLEVIDDLDPQSEELLQLSQRQLLQEVVKANIARRVRQLTECCNNFPTKSALSRVRQELKRDRQMQDFIQECTNNEQKPFVKQLKDCRIENFSLLEWLDNIFRTDNETAEGQSDYFKDKIGYSELLKYYSLKDEDSSRAAIRDMLPDWKKMFAEQVLSGLIQEIKKAEKGGRDE